MKRPLKICLINIGLALFFAFLFASMDGRLVKDFTLWYGLIALGGGLIDIIVGLVLLFKEDKSYAQGFLLSGALLMLTGFASCNFVNMNFH
ncbi:MAG: hypothetical protein V4722_05040 [Bacteroidota bacterium]